MGSTSAEGQKGVCFKGGAKNIIRSSMEIQ